MPTPSMQTDPSGTAGGIVTIAGAAIALLIAFGVPLTPDQEAAILGFLVVAGPAITALLIRRRAFAPSTVDALLDGTLNPAEMPGIKADAPVVPSDDRQALEAALLTENGNAANAPEAPPPTEVDDVIATDLDDAP